MPFIQFANQKAFIKVTNTQTDVVVHINKTGLLIQKNNESSFLLKNDSFIGYYNFADVDTSASDIDGLIRTLVNFVEEDDENAITDRSQRLIDIRTNYKSSGATEIVEKTEASATSSHEIEKSLTKMEIATEVESRIVRQSKEYIPEGFVSNIITMVEATLSGSDASPADTFARAGIFEDRDDLSVNTDNGGRGAFFEYDFGSSTTYAVIRTNDGSEQSDTKVASADWNIDKLDGAGQSGITLDTSTNNFFVFDWDPVKKNLKMGILAEDRVVYCHEFTSNVKLLNVPLRWEIAHEGSEAPSEAAYMFQGKASVFHSEDPRIHSKSTDIGTELKTVNDSPKPMFSLRLKENANRAKIVPQKIDIVNTASGGVAKWELVRNATLTDANFQDIENSFAQFSSAETDAADGKVIASGFIFDSGVTTVNMENRDISVMSNLAGEPETLTLRIINVAGVLQLLAGIEWVERE